MIVTTTCPNCGSRNIEDLNGELKETVKEITVQIKAECQDCGHEFEYCSDTDYGHEIGVDY